MPHLFGRDYTRAELLPKIGRLEQIGGVTPLTLAEGREDGVRCFQMRTGTGLSVTVATDRALDIVAADWQGRSLCWQSAGAAAHPSFYEPAGLGWLRTFPGGLLATCGLTWYGAPHDDPEAGVEGPSLGLHGRIANTPAKQVSYGGRWEGDDYVMWVEGVVDEWILFGAHLEMRRRIWARLGENKLYLRDVITNRGYLPQEHMIMYHVNLGFPLLDEGARYVFPSRQVFPRSPFALQHAPEWDRFGPPQPGLEEMVYYHELAGDAQGQTCVALVNRETDSGQPLGLAMRYNLSVLPVLCQWRMPGAGNYVTGVEPGTNFGDGRPRERAAGRMISLAPDEARTYDLEFDLLTSLGEIEAVEREVTSLTGGRPPEIAAQAVVG
jgi:hypothetical protein